MHGKALIIFVVYLAYVWADQDPKPATFVNIEPGSALPGACENSGSSSSPCQTESEASAVQSVASIAKTESPLVPSKQVGAEVSSWPSTEDEHVLPKVTSTAAPLEASSRTELPPDDERRTAAPHGAAAAIDEQPAAADAALAEEQHGQAAQPAAEPAATLAPPAAQPPPPSESEPLLEEELRNFAQIKDGAKVIQANKEAKKLSALLDSDSDTYVKNDCKADKWYIIELSQVAKITRVELAQFELYSSRVKAFEVRGRQSHPRVDGVELSKGLNSTTWRLLGAFTAENKKGSQLFTLEHPTWLRYLLLHSISHYGTEPVCAINGFAAYGKSAAEEFEDHLAAEEALRYLQTSLETPPAAVLEPAAPLLSPPLAPAAGGVDVAGLGSSESEGTQAPTQELGADGAAPFASLVASNLSDSAAGDAAALAVVPTEGAAVAAAKGASGETVWEEPAMDGSKAVHGRPADAGHSTDGGGAVRTEQRLASHEPSAAMAVKPADPQGQRTPTSSESPPAVSASSERSALEPVATIVAADSKDLSSATPVIAGKKAEVEDLPKQAISGAAAADSIREPGEIGVESQRPMGPPSEAAAAAAAAASGLAAEQGAGEQAVSPVSDVQQQQQQPAEEPAETAGNQQPAVSQQQVGHQPAEHPTGGQPQQQAAAAPGGQADGADLLASLMALAPKAKASVTIYDVLLQEIKTAKLQQKLASRLLAELQHNLTTLHTELGGEVQEATSLADAAMEAKIGASVEARVERLSQVIDTLQGQLEDSRQRQECLLWVVQAVGGALALRLLWHSLRRPWVRCLLLLALVSSSTSWWLLQQDRGDVLVSLDAAVEAAVKHLQYIPFQLPEATLQPRGYFIA
ncbi:hypothetical protein N2152v2_007855 [Parachlorella kessleri]